MAAPLRNVCLSGIFVQNFNVSLGFQSKTGFTAKVLAQNVARASHFKTYTRFSFVRSFANIGKTVKSEKKNALQKLGCALGLLAVGSCGYMLHKVSSNPVLAQQLNIPQFPPSRRICSKSDQTGLKLTLYQYQTCPFCCKVRAFLDYHGFAYDVIEVNSVWRTQVKWSQYKKVPILLCEGLGPDGYLQLNDSSVIVSILKSYMEGNDDGLEKLVTYYPPLEAKNERGKVKIEFPNRYFIMYGEHVPADPEDKRKEERVWRQWTDAHMVHMLSPNVYRSPREAVQAFRWFCEAGEWEKHFNWVERQTVIYVGAAAMFVIGKMLKKRYSLKEDVRESLFEACDEWIKGIGPDRTFMGGDKPNLADLAMYGVLNSIEGCNAFQEVLQKTNIEGWYQKTRESVIQKDGSELLSLRK